MPRINNKIRSSKKTAATYYDHNEKYKSQKTESKYESSDNLIFWSEFCGEKAGTLSAFDTENYKIATDRSKDSSSIELYASKTALTHVYDETSAQYVLSILPDDLQKNLDPATLDVCGDPCFWLNTSTVVQQPDSDNCGISAIGADYLFTENNSLLNFVDSGSDKPFTISIWYYPVDFNDSRATHYNKGGISRLSGPTIFHKPLQYGLFIRECGKLEFVLFDTAITSSIASGPAYTYTGTSSSLTVRSNANVLVPGQWNHISVTYDGSATRAGMKIYVNCDDVVNTGDVPNVVGEKSRSVSGTSNIALWNVTHALLMADIYSNDGETPADYQAMHSYATPLMFAASAIPSNANSMIGLSLSGMLMSPVSKLPPSFIFDIAIWSAALSAEEVGAVCDATKNCIVVYSDFFGRDSGYINLSPKIMQKVRDQKQNSLSVIDRVGDRSDRRVKSRKPFNDNNSLIFGRKISDELKKGNYKFASLNISNKSRLFGIPRSGIIPDKNLWIVQNALIKREQKKNKIGEKIYDKALAFHSENTESWIQTKEEVNNAIIDYDLILGPYNQNIGHLNLSTVPISGTNLFVEIQTTDGSPWQIVRTHTITSPAELTLSEFYSPNFANGIILTTSQHQFRRSFSIHFSSINSGGESYKIRFRTLDACWGIGRIEILSANQTVRYPILIDHDSYSGQYIDQNFIATPHTSSDIVSIGRTVSGISDNSLYFTDLEQGTTPFKDSMMTPFAGNSFFDAGIEEDITPGFSSPLKDKTSFTINLDSTSNTEIGFINKISGGSGATNSSFAQPLFASWDNVDKKWKHPNPSASALSVGYKPIFLANNLDDQLKYHKQIFSTIDLIGTASGPTNKFVFNQFSEEVLSSYNQPVTSFGFPHQSVYGIPAGSADMPVENLIKMSDYITKPFLLEKVVIEFNAKFEFSDDATTEDAFRMMYVSGTINSRKASDRHYDNASVLIPSFYILNVKKNVGKTYSSEILLDDNVIQRKLTTHDSSFDYKSLANKDNIGCDIVTYGQMTMYITGSDSKMNMNKALESGLGRDAIYDISKLNGQTTYSLSSHINPITSSFRIEMPVRNMPRTKYTQRSIHKDSSNNYFGIFSNNPAGGRSLPGISGSMNITENRGLLNNFAAIDSKNTRSYPLANTSEASEPYDVNTSGFILENDNSSTSPYVLLPKDTLSLGFAYPVPMLGVFMQPDTNESKVNKMTLGGNYKVHFYGSLIKEGREFHENMNQALTTTEISEPIGCESVVDQFNISTRDEYFKSYTDKIPIITSLEVPKIGNSYLDEIVYSFENRSTGPGTSRIFGTAVIKPQLRIGLKLGSKIHQFVTYKAATATVLTSSSPSRTHSFGGNYSSAKDQPQLGSLPPQTITNLAESKHIYRKTFTFPFTEHYNNERRFFDEGKLEADEVGEKLGKNQQIKSRERYIFSHKSFGQHTDLIDPSKYSKFKNLSTVADSSYSLLDTAISEANNSIKYNSSPVKVVFVSGTINENNIMEYYTIPNSTSAASANKTYNSTITTAFNDIIAI